MIKGGGEGRGRAEYRGGENGGGEWRVGWDINASWDGSLLPVSGKCIAIVAMFHVPSPPPFSLRILGSPPEKFSLHLLHAFTSGILKKTSSKVPLLVFCANNNNIMHGVSEALARIFLKFPFEFYFPLRLFIECFLIAILQIN